MSAKEKAIALVGKYYKLMEDNSCYIRDSDCSIEFDETKGVAKAYAIIACDVVIEVLGRYALDPEIYAGTDVTEYWQKIKQEIKLL